MYCVADMECDPAPHEMDKGQPWGNKCKFLWVFYTIPMYALQKCNLHALQTSPGVYGAKTWLSYQHKVLITWKVGHHCIQKILVLMYCVVDMQCNPAVCETDKDQPQGNKHKPLLVSNAILIHTLQECNLCTL